MNNAITLLLISVLPVFVLLFYIYKRDKYEKEPLPLLIICFVAGGILAIAGVLLIVGTISSLFPADESTMSGAIVKSFAYAAIPEEIFKFLVLYFVIWKNKNFNEYFDGIVYAAFVSLGFACTENILYVFQNGISIGIIRALFSVPLHFLCGVLMGYFFAFAKFQQEKRNWYFFLALFFPILCHGIFNSMLYSFAVVEESIVWALMLLFVVLDILLWLIAVRRMKWHSAKSIFKPE